MAVVGPDARLGSWLGSGVDVCPALDRSIVCCAPRTGCCVRRCDERLHLCGSGSGEHGGSRSPGVACRAILVGLPCVGSNKL
eukprot:scaffold22093_cov59-Phaeocystis_antarctica.AAC.3